MKSNWVLGALLCVSISVFGEGRSYGSYVWRPLAWSGGATASSVLYCGSMLMRSGKWGGSFGMHYLGYLNPASYFSAPHILDNLKRVIFPHNVDEELLEFIEKKDRAKVSEYLIRGANPNYSLRPPIVAASLSGDRAVLELILNAHLVSVDQPDPDSGITALMVAVQNGDAAIVDSLRRWRDASRDVVDTAGRSALAHAVENKRVSLISTLMTPDNVNKKDMHGWAPLTRAINMDHQGMVVALLEHPEVDVNITNQRRQSALLLALYRKNKTVARLLVEGGADVWEDERELFERYGWGLDLDGWQRSKESDLESVSSSDSGSESEEEKQQSWLGRLMFPQPNWDEEELVKKEKQGRWWSRWYAKPKSNPEASLTVWQEGRDGLIMGRSHGLEYRVQGLSDALERRMVVYESPE